MTPDFGNAFFEGIGGCLLWLSVIKLYHDKMVRGIHIGPILFWTVWGFWNLYYYPSLGQWWSFCFGINVVAANVVWVCQMLYYHHKNGGCL